MGFELFYEIAKLVMGVLTFIGIIWFFVLIDRNMERRNKCQICGESLGPYSAPCRKCFDIHWRMKNLKEQSHEQD